MLRNFGLTLSFLVLIPFVSFSQDSPRSLYDQGRYKEALELLQKNGLTTAADHYNAGNCLFKLGKLGQALAHYEKAEALSPGHADVRYNIALVQGSLEQSGALSRDQSLWFGTLVPQLRQIPEAAANFFLATATIGVAIACWRARRSGLTLKGAVTQSEFLATLGIWGLICGGVIAATLARRIERAVVIADLGMARSGPNQTFTELFKLPAGTKVELTGEARDGWRQIRFSLGNVGWIGDKDLLSL